MMVYITAALPEILELMMKLNVCDTSRYPKRLELAIFLSANKIDFIFMNRTGVLSASHMTVTAS
jgi:hypothetical protein